MKYIKGLTSIVLPTWIPTSDKKKYISWTLKSLAKTTDRPFEIIAFNNEANENSKKFLRSFKKIFDNNKYCKSFRVVSHTENQGWTGGLQTGLEDSRGEYVCFSNDDLIYEDKWLSKMLKHFKNKIAVVGPTSNFVSGLQDVKFSRKNDYEKKVNYLIGFCMLFKRKALDSIVGKGTGDVYYVDPRFYPGGSEELDICFRITKRGYSMAIAKDVFIHHFGSRSLQHFKEFDKTNPMEFFQPRLDELRAKHDEETMKVIEFQHSPKFALGIPTVGHNDSLFLANYPWFLQTSWSHFGFNNILPLIAPRNVVHLGRGEIVKKAIIYGAEYLMFLDDDMIIPEDTLIRLASHGKDFVSALAYKRNKPYFPCWVGSILVETNNGSKEIKDIRRGEIVRTHSGKLKSVTNISKRWVTHSSKNKLVDIYTKNTKTNIAILRSTQEHPYYVLRNGKKQWIEAKNLTTKDLMLYPYCKKNSVIIFNYSTYHNKKISKKVNIDKEFARFLGLYLAEGCGDEKTLRFSFSKKEKEYIKFVSEIIEKHFDGKPTIMNNKDGSSVTVAITRKKLGNNFNKWFGKGAKNKYIPEFVFRWDIRNRLAFIKGFLEGDGCLKNIKQYGVPFSSASEKLTSDIKRLCEKSGLKITKIYKNKRNETKWNNRKISGGIMYSARLSSKSWYKLLDILEGEILDKHIGIPITKKEIRNVKSGRYVYNLEVEKDNSYIVNSSSVHNCIFTGKDSKGAWIPDTRLRQGLVEVDVAGLSCCLIKMDLIKKLLKNKEKQIFKRGGLFYFTRFGEDFNFSQELKKMGVKIWADTNLVVDHLGRHLKINDQTFLSYNQQQQAIKQERIRNKGRIKINK